MKTDPARAAFTLLEMAVVLAILALVTHLAVARLERDARATRARRQLEEIRRAIVGFDDDADPAGRPSRSGFLADMGRLPVTLDELWSQGSNAVFQARRASDDDTVWVAGGWRGPYLRRGLRDGRLADPWGNAIAYDPRPDGSFRLISLGSDGSPGWDGATAEARDIALTNDVATATLTVLPYFLVRATDAGGGGTDISDTDPRPATLRVYEPRGGDVAVVVAAEPSLASGAPLVVEGLTPGPRVLRLERDGVRLPPRPVLLQPGPNALSLTERLSATP